MFKKAFSLAEVLIVLAIIGTVATLTIPNLVGQYDDEQTVVKLKQFKGDLDLALQKSILKYGTFDYWYTGNLTNDDKKDAVERVMEFLAVVSDDVTFPDVTYANDSFYKYELKNGLILAVKFGAFGSCSGQACNYMQFIVATDGQNGNTYGESIFGFDVNVYEPSVKPFGFNTDVGTNNALNITSMLDGTNWAIHQGNLDYLKCKSSLNWQNKTSCD